MPSEKLKDPVIPVLLVLVLVGAVAGFYYWLSGQREAAQPPATVEAPPPAEPQIRYPLQTAEPGKEVKPLPPLAESDPALQEAATALIGKESLDRLFNIKDIARRIVVTVDNLPRKKLPQRYSIAKPVAGQFLVTGKGEAAAINPVNHRRYTGYARLADAIDTKKLVAVYLYFYPLLQEEYKNLGFPKRYFNDRVVEAIDDLLAAPEIKTSIRVVQPKVMYEFADPSLEALSAGQKIMIRIGPENATAIKAKLREIRRELASGR
jgi:hypothetical protein